MNRYVLCKAPHGSLDGSPRAVALQQARPTGASIPPAPEAHAQAKPVAATQALDNDHQGNMLGCRMVEGHRPRQQHSSLCCEFVMLNLVNQF